MNWIERINRAEEANSGFTFADRVDATDWVTCACGEQDPRIPREESGAPEDEQLLDLGVGFAEAVQDDDWALAREILFEIEERVAVILASVAR